MKTMTAKHFYLNASQEEIDDFVERFYELAPRRVDDLETSCPWGCPWTHNGTYFLTGSTTIELAESYFELVQNEIVEILRGEE